MARRGDIKGIMKNPAQRRDLVISSALFVIELESGRKITREQAEETYDRMLEGRRQ